MKLHIAFYTDSYLPATDGVVNSIINFRKELERRGHKVYIFASSSMGSKAMPGRNVFLYRGIEFKPYPQYSMAIFPYNSAVKLRNLEVDIVHAHTPFMMGFASMLIAKMSGYPLVGSFHTLINNRSVIEDYYPKNEQLRKFTAKYLWKYVKFFYRKCDAVAVPSKSTYSILARQGIRNISVVPNSVDMKSFRPTAGGRRMRGELGIGSGEKMVLYLGRISREKRLDVMIKAAARLCKKRDDMKFVIGGTGPAEYRYKSMVKRLGLQKHVSFIGFVREKDLPKLYAASDAFCIPSTFETQGIASIEAMASGKPVVGADCLALSDLIVNGRNGEKFRPGDYLGCARKIERVLNNPDAYISNAISTAEEFSVEKMADRLLDVYRMVMEKAHGSDYSDAQRSGDN